MPTFFANINMLQLGTYSMSDACGHTNLYMTFLENNCAYNLMIYNFCEQCLTCEAHKK